MTTPDDHADERTAYGPAGAPGAPGTQGTEGRQGTEGPQGLAGTAGSPGTTGTPGATGAVGGQGRPGARGEQGRPGPRSRIAGPVLALPFVLLAVAGGYAIDRSNKNAITSNDRITHADARRTCERGNAVRAELHLSAPTLGRAKLQRERRIRIPLLDCAPQFQGHAARPLPFVQQVRFERFFKRTDRVPLVQGGKVMDRVNPRVPAGSG